MPIRMANGRPWRFIGGVSTASESRLMPSDVSTGE